MSLTQEDYKKFDSRLQYKEDIYNDLAEYNKKHHTTFEYFSEYAHKLNENGSSYVEISKPFGRSANSTYKHLKIMGVHTKKAVGGARNVTMTPENAAKIYILAKQGVKPQKISEECGCTRATVSQIKNKRAWQTNEEFQEIIGRSQNA